MDQAMSELASIGSGNVSGAGEGAGGTPVAAGPTPAQPPRKITAKTAATRIMVMIMVMQNSRPKPIHIERDGDYQTEGSATVEIACVPAPTGFRAEFPRSVRRDAQPETPSRR
jgi:hypothetical protein